MEIVPVAEAKACFAALLARAEAGEEIVIVRGGKAVARLVPEPHARALSNEIFGKAWAAGGIAVETPPDLPLPTLIVD
jgi:prevent-host-death family protein